MATKNRFNPTVIHLAQDSHIQRTLSDIGCEFIETINSLDPNSNNEEAVYLAITKALFLAYRAGGQGFAEYLKEHS